MAAPPAASRVREPRSTFAARSKPVSVGGLIARFTAAGLIVTLGLAALIAYLSQQAGTEQATESARQVTWLSATGIAAPLLTPELIAGDPAALSAFNDVMQAHVLQGSLVRVKVWTADGTIVYSDESRLIGQQFPLGEEETEALDDQTADTEISDLTRPENVYEQSYEKLLEVYVGIRGTDGQPLLFEAYYRYDDVAQAGQALWRQYAPAALGGLLLLQLIQIPFAWSLANRLQGQQRQSGRLLQRAVDASDAERRRIAGDLHDGIVQRLTGMTYTLDAARLGKPDSDRDSRLIGLTASQLRSCTSELRSLLVDIYPPNLEAEGLPSALSELAISLERSGVTVDLDLDPSGELPLSASSVLFRAAQEMLRNVASHSDAQHVEVRLTVTASTATLAVDDDGRGFEQADLAGRLVQGHVGLRSLGDLVADAGGELTVRSAPGQGTRAEVVVPVR